MVVALGEGSSWVITGVMRVPTILPKSATIMTGDLDLFEYPGPSALILILHGREVLLVPNKNMQNKFRYS